MTTPIKDLQPGDDFAGKLYQPEYTVDGDEITIAFAKIEAQRLSVQQLTKEKVSVTQAIANGQAQLAEINKRLDMIVQAGGSAEGDPKPEPEEIPK